MRPEAPDWIPYDLPHELVPKTWGGRFRGQMQRWFLMRFTGDDARVSIELSLPLSRLLPWFQILRRCARTGPSSAS